LSLTDEEIGRVIRAALSQGTSSPEASVKPKAKSTPKKKPRKPSAYNQYMKKELAKLKKKHPRTNHQARFKKAAKSWKRSAERKRSMK
jgi:hypothetical protein